MRLGRGGLVGAALQGRQLGVPAWGQPGGQYGWGPVHGCGWSISKFMIIAMFQQQCPSIYCTSIYYILESNPHPMTEASTLPIPAEVDKICISEDCQLSDPYITASNEHQHEHNGTIVALRVAKVRQLHDRLITHRQGKSAIRAYLGQLRRGIEQKMAEWEAEYGGEDQMGEVQGVLAGFFSGDAPGAFYPVWSKVKQSSRALDEMVEDFEAVKIQINNELSAIINKDTVISEKQSSGHASSQFLQKFAHALNYLPLQLKSKPNPGLIQPLAGLCTNDRSQNKMLCRLYQLCQQNQQALSIYQKLLQQTSFDIELLNRKALLLKKMGRYQQSYDDFSMLIGLLQDKASAQLYHFYRGELCMQMGRYAEAYNEYQKCMGRDSMKSHNVNKSIGMVLYKQGKLEESIPMLKKALQHQNITSLVKDQISELLYQAAKSTNNSALMLESLNNLFKSKPNDVQLLFKRARVYHQLKDHTNAIKDYDAAIAKVDNIAGLYYNRAVELIYSGQRANSIADLKKAIELDPNFKQAVHLLACTCFELLQQPQPAEVAQQLTSLALNSYGYSLKFYPQNESIWHNMGLLESEKNPQKAYECFCKAIEISPKQTASYLGKIKCAVKLKKQAKTTLLDVYQMIELGDRTVTLFLIKCALEEELGLHEEALATVELVLKADPDNETARDFRQKILNVIKTILESKQNTVNSTEAPAQN